MTQWSFGITDHRAFYEQLVRPAYDDLMTNKLDVRKAVVFAILAYHLCEWVVKCKGGDLRQLGILKGSATAARNELSSLLNLEHMRDIADGSKHAERDRGSPQVQSTGQSGSFSSGFSSGFDQERLVYRVAGQSVDFLPYATASIAKWEQFLADHC